MSNAHHLPSYESHLFCYSCGYQSPGFNNGKDDIHVYHCHLCKSIVTPAAVPFRFTPPPCPKCKHRLEKSERVYVQTLDSSTPIECPRCENVDLRVVHFADLYFISTGDCLPSKGEIIQALVVPESKADLLPAYILSPRLIDEVEISYESVALESLEPGMHEFRVVGVCTQPAASMTLEWFKKLPSSECWPEYYAQG